ncbi:unnamed protein product [Auanema sp. JU1783]|nr:unnamed protein product [Auanema sp. JU1783]
MTSTEYPNVTVTTSPEDLRSKLKQYILDTVKPILEFNGLISIGVSGGSMPTVLCDVFRSLEKFDWHRIRIFMVDERVVPINHEDSNCRLYLEKLPQQLHQYVIPLALCDTLPRTAQQYETALRQHIMPELIGGLPRFDILFLGMGPDGHTCSLFPDHHLLKVDSKPWVLYIDDSPKPPPERVTLSLHCLNAAKNVAFIISGEEKADLTKSVLDRDPSYPASLVQPLNKHLRFFLDKGAAKKL